MSKITIDRKVLEQAVDALRNKYSDVIYEQSSDLAGDFELDLYNMQRALETNSEDVSAMAQPQQEPRFLYDEEEGLLHDHFGDAPTGCIPLYTSPPASTATFEALRKQLLTALDTAISEVGHKEVALGLVSEQFISPPARKPMTYATNPHNVLRNGLTLLQQNPDCAARLDPTAKDHGWLYIRGADGQWVTLRQLSAAEIETAYDQAADMAVLQGTRVRSAHGIK